MRPLSLAGILILAGPYLTLILNLGPMDTLRDPLVEVYFNIIDVLCNPL